MNNGATGVLVGTVLLVTAALAAWAGWRNSGG
jgi:hypothetical protein